MMRFLKPKVFVAESDPATVRLPPASQFGPPVESLEGVMMSLASLAVVETEPSAIALAVPVKFVAVILRALKSPFASLVTIALFVLLEVSVVAEFGMFVKLDPLPENVVAVIVLFALI
jgi:hypothetical protein